MMGAPSCVLKGLLRVTEWPKKARPRLSFSLGPAVVSNQVMR